MRHGWAKVIVVGLFTFLLAGCSPTSEGARAQIDENVQVLDSAAQDVLEALDAVGLHGAAASGRIELCQSAPAAGAAYRAGISVPVRDDRVAAFDAITDELEAAGWQQSDASHDVEVDPAIPWGQFVRDDLRITINTGGFSSGGKHYDADEMTFALRRANECVRIPDGMFEDLQQELKKEILPRE